MRLGKPGDFSNFGIVSLFNVDKYGRRKVLLRVLAIAIILLFLGLAYKVIRDRYFNADTTGFSKLEKPADANIRQLKDKSDVSSLRILASAYLDKPDYEKAVATMKKLAAMTNDPNDYAALMGICATNKVADKQACLSDADNKLKTNLSRVEFSTAYSLARTLDVAGQKSMSKPYYQQAFDTYKAEYDDEFTMSKDEIKSKIDSIR